MGATPYCVQVTGHECSQDAVASQPHELQRTSTRCAAAGSALAIVGAMRRSGEETELAAVILIVMSLGLEVLAALRRRSNGAGKLQHSVLERYKDPLLLSTLCPALLTMTIFTAWGAGAVQHFGIVPRSLEGLPGVVFGGLAWSCLRLLCAFFLASLSLECGGSGSFGALRSRCWCDKPASGISLHCSHKRLLRVVHGQTCTSRGSKWCSLWLSWLAGSFDAEKARCTTLHSSHGLGSCCMLQRCPSDAWTRCSLRTTL